MDDNQYTERESLSRKEDAEARKADAEAVAAQAKAEHEKADARKSDLESGKLELERVIVQYTLERERMGFEKFEREYRESLTDDKYYHFYPFTSEVTEASVRNCMSQLKKWSRMEPECSIEICFTSPGGSVIDGLALFDFIQQLKAQGHHITTSALGIAASMAGVLLQAGTTRVISPETWVLIHETQFGAIGKFGEVEDRYKLVESVQDRILDIFASRSKLSKATLKKKWKRTDWWLSSQEMHRYDLVDEVK